MLKDGNKKSCGLMLQYNDDFRLAHSLKNGSIKYVKTLNIPITEPPFGIE